MYKNISDDFFLAMRPLLYVSRALGLAPFAYVKKTLPGGTIAVQLGQSAGALFYSIFIVVLHFCLLAVSLTFKYLYVFSLMSATDTLTGILLHTASVTSLISLVSSVTKNRKAIFRIMSCIVQTDSFILTSSREYYRKAKNNLILQLLVVFTFLGLITVYDYIIWNSMHGIINLSYCHIYVGMLIEWIVVIQFMNVVVLLRDRFSLLNTRLINLSGIFKIENSKKGFYFTELQRSCISVKEMKSQLTGKEILTFNNIHDNVFDTALLVKCTYEVQIFFSLLSTFAGVTIWSYYGLCYLYGYFGPENAAVSVSRVALSQMMWSLLHVAKLLCITIPCHSANNKMAHTSTVLRKLLLAFHGDPGTMRELERFSQHVALRKFKFKAFGFLSLDLSLLVSMMGAVATYLVILMQIKVSVSAPPACSKNVTTYVSDNDVSSTVV
ncbi:hypothetical protein Cfor_10569 [Coptotermes formosanus]|uniref:Gustatory receptor n=1 Tax=Coptotermes formosanus TaxID=36987 RepID=A0A6L2Q570_COPFO|nr:hypothetical protein Cfor_10569 [Coptotermes formosanus]